MFKYLARFVCFDLASFLNEAFGLFFVLRFCLGFAGHLRPMSRSISQPLAPDTTDRQIGALQVLNPEGRAGVVPEIIFRKIAIKMFLGTVLIYALHAAFKDAEEPLDGIGADFTPAIFAFAVANKFMAREISLEEFILARFVGHDDGPGINIALEYGNHVFCFQAVNDHAPRLTAIAVNKAQNLVLVSIATALLLALGFHRTVIADEGFINLDNTAASSEHQPVAVLQGFADPVPHEPSGLEGDAQGSVQLVCADALLGRANKEHRLKPDMQLDVAGLKNGADLDGEWLAALVALVSAYAGALALQLVNSILTCSAMGANRTVRPYTRLYEFVGRFFIMKVWC